MNPDSARLEIYPIGSTVVVTITENQPERAYVYGTHEKVIGHITTALLTICGLGALSNSSVKRKEHI